MAKRNTKSQSNGFLSQVKWGESYTSLFLGAVVVVVVLILAFSFIRSRNLLNQNTDTTSTSTEQTRKLPKTYTVKQGDNLWIIAENLYGSGYNWVDIANANKLENPNSVNEGSNLNIPSVTPKTSTVVINMVERPITGVTYKVEKGDYLWDIAVRAYGDGFKWVEIAKANKISSPNLIYSGTVLKLPR